MFAYRTGSPVAKIRDRSEAAIADNTVANLGDRTGVPIAAGAGPEGEGGGRAATRSGIIDPQSIIHFFFCFFFFLNF
jgi:hypothetical protein